MINTGMMAPPAPILENAVGYSGEAEWLGLYWEPAGDEAMVTDGRMTATGCWEGFLLFTSWPCLTQFDLGSSEGPAKEWLLVNRKNREVFVAKCREARLLLRGQWPALPAYSLTAEQWEELARAIEKELQGRPQPSLEELQAAYEQQVEAVAALRAWMTRN